MPGIDKDFCVKELLVHKKLGWVATSKDDYVKKKTNEPTKYEFKTIDCKTEGKKYLYKAKSAPSTDKWKCNGSGPCVKDSSGTYNSQAECETATACDSGTTPPPPGTTYSVCPGPTYSNGCKDSGAPNPNGIIYKVQGCVGATQDSKFGPKTEKALKLKTGKTTFSDDDVSTICSGSPNQDNQNQGSQGGKMTPEKQKEFFDKLIDTGRINDGYVQELKPNSDLASKDGSIYRYCYIKKFECTRNEQGKIVAIGNGTPISGKADVTYSQENLFVILFPDLSYGYMEKRGEIITNPTYTWSPGDASASNVFLEQKINFGPILGSSWDFSSGSGSGGATTSSSTSSQTNTQSQSSSNTPSTFNEVEETEKVMGPIKEKALKIIDEWDKSNEKKLDINLGKAKINNEIDEARIKIQGKNPKDFCSPQNKAELAKAKEDIAKKKENLKEFLKPEDDLYMGQLVSLLAQVESECAEIAKKKRKSQNQGSSQGSGTQGSGSSQGSGTQGSGSATVVTGNRKDELRKLFGFVDEDGNTMSPKTTISKMNKIPERGFVKGMGSVQYAINNYGARSEWFEDYNEMMDTEGLSEYKLKFPDDFEDEDYAGEEIDKENYSALTPINSDANSQFKKFTFGDFLGNNKSKLPIFQIQSGSGEFDVEKTKCIGNPREKLINYLTAAFSASRKFRGSNELDYFERCLATKKLQNAFEDEGPLRRNDFEEVDTDRLPFGVFNNKLNLKEIIKLLRGEEVNGIRINNLSLIDKNFYREGFAVYESVRKTVKKNLNEAITKKNNLKLTESTLTKILTNIKRKGY